MWEASEPRRPAGETRSGGCVDLARLLRGVDLGEPDSAEERSEAARALAWRRFQRLLNEGARIVRVEE